MSKKKISYSDAVAEIEQTIAIIQSGNLDVDDLHEKVSRVAELIEQCKEKLYKAEEAVNKILKDDAVL